MKNQFFMLALLMAMSAGPLWSQESSNKPVENRFLFVIETSAATSRSAKAARDAVRELIQSGVQGQMRAGDTLGLWTFNDELYTSFPMQQWVPTVSQQMGERAEAFLKKVRYEKKSQLNVMLPSLDTVIQASKSITVILISDGHEPVQGTPFDQEVNAVYSVYGRSLRDSRAPFVTVFIGRNGKLIAHAVSSALDAIQIPTVPLPIEPVLSQTKTNNLAAAKKRAAVTNEIAPPRKIAKSNIILTKPVATNQPPLVTNIVVAAPEIEVSPLAAKTNLPASTAPPIVVPVPTNIPLPVPETPAVPAQVKIEPSPPVPVASPVPQTVAVAATPPVSIPNPVGNSTKVENTVAPIPTAPLAVKSEETKPGATPAQSKESSVSSATNDLVKKMPAAPAVVAVQTPSSSQGSILIGASLLVIAGLLGLLVFRNSRSKSQPSLISRSMNQPPK